MKFTLLIGYKTAQGTAFIGRSEDGRYHPMWGGESLGSYHPMWGGESLGSYHPMWGGESLGSYHPMWGGESLGSYHNIAGAVEDVAGGHVFGPSDGTDTGSLGLSSDPGDWLPAKELM